MLATQQTARREHERGETRERNERSEKREEKGWGVERDPRGGHLAKVKEITDFVRDDCSTHTAEQRRVRTSHTRTHDPRLKTDNHTHTLLCTASVRYTSLSLPQTCPSPSGKMSNTAVEDGFSECSKTVFTGAKPVHLAGCLRENLEFAVAEGNFDRFLALMEAMADGGVGIEGYRGCDGRTLFDAAARGGNTEIMARLLKAEARSDINVVSDSSERSALYLATTFGHEEAAICLVEAGADVQFHDPEDQRDVLFEAVYGGLDKLVDSLLKHMASQTAHGPSGSTPLHIAANSGFNGMVVALLAFGADQDALDADRNSPLLLAARKGHAVVTSTLLSAGAGFKAWGSSGCTAFEEAAGRGDAEVLKAFTLHDLCSPDMREINSALVMAVIEGEVGAIDVLAEAGGDVNQIDSDGDGGCHLAWAMSTGNLKVMRALIRHGALVDVKDNGAGTLLTYACRIQLSGFWEVIDILLRNGADETIIDAEGKACLQLLDEGDGCEGEGYGFPEDKERAHLLLTRAPNDRAWRRRSWIVIFRSRVLKEESEAAPAYGGSRAPGVGYMGVLEEEGVFRNVVSFL